MDRRIFIKNSAALAAAGIITPESALCAMPEKTGEPLIASSPMLQNFAETSIGIAFAVSDMANGFVDISEKADMSDSQRYKCGGYRVTDMNSDVMLIRITGLKPSTEYYYRIGADRISYKGGYNMKVTGTENDAQTYSFKTAGEKTRGHFCMINDTHAHWDTFGPIQKKLLEINPSCVVWNGDATNCQENIEDLKEIFLNPPIDVKGYASHIPYLFSPGNHDCRGMASRHLEKVWMFRQPEERLSRDWDLGRNFAVRVGDIALIGLDTAEDKVDSNPIFAGLFNSEKYREAQVAWLAHALKQREILSAPYLVAFCHIPLYDSDPTHNPGNVQPDDTDPKYSANFAYWQSDCARLWTPLLEKAGCQLVLTAHYHQYRFDAPDGKRNWAHIVGGGPRPNDFPTVIEGIEEDGMLKVKIHNITSSEIEAQYSFKPRK